jgi:hypothetical protein
LIRERSVPDLITWSMFRIALMRILPQAGTLRPNE